MLMASLGVFAPTDTLANFLIYSRPWASLCPVFMHCVEWCQCFGILVLLPGRAETLESALHLQILTWEAECEDVSAP